MKTLEEAKEIMNSWPCPPVVAEVEALFHPDQLTAGGMEDWIPELRNVIKRWLTEDDEDHQTVILRALYSLARYRVLWPSFLTTDLTVEKYDVYEEVKKVLWGLLRKQIPPPARKAGSTITKEDLLPEEEPIFHSIHNIRLLAEPVEVPSPKKLQRAVEMIAFLRSLPVDWNEAKMAAMKQKANVMEDDYLTNLPLYTNLREIGMDGPSELCYNKKDRKVATRVWIKRYRSHVGPDDPPMPSDWEYAEERKKVRNIQAKVGIYPFAKMLYEPEKGKEEVVAFHEELDPTGMTQLVVRLRRLLIFCYGAALKSEAVIHPDPTFRQSCLEAAQWLYYHPSG
jgi:hypothetical protein